MAGRRRTRVAMSGVTTATLVALATLAGQGTAAAATIDCTWVATASRLLASLDRAADPRAEGIRTQLLELGFSATGQAPAGCTGDAGDAGASDTDEPLHGVAQKGIFTDTGSTGQTLQVSGGSIASADPQPGDVVEIAAGTYDGFTPKSGAEGGYVTYRAAPGAKVVITGGGGDKGVIDLGNVSYVHLDGLTVQDASSFGIYGDKPDHVALTNMEVAGSGDGGLVIIGGSNIYIDGCNVHNTNQKSGASHEGLTIGESTKTFEVLNCMVHDNGEEGIDTKYESTDGMVHHNAVWGNKGPNIYADSVSDVDISHNWVWGATGSDKAGIMLAVEAEWSKSDQISNVTVHDNVVWGNAGGSGNGIKFWTGPFSDIVVENNVVGDGNNPPENAPSGVQLIDNIAGQAPGAAKALVAGLGGDSGTDEGRAGGGSSDEGN